MPILMKVVTTHTHTYDRRLIIKRLGQVKYIMGILIHTFFVDPRIGQGGKPLPDTERFRMEGTV